MEGELQLDDVHCDLSHLRINCKHSHYGGDLVAIKRFGSLISRGAQAVSRVRSMAATQSVDGIVGGGSMEDSTRPVAGGTIDGCVLVSCYCCCYCCLSSKWQQGKCWRYWMMEVGDDDWERWRSGKISWLPLFFIPPQPRLWNAGSYDSTEKSACSSG